MFIQMIFIIIGFMLLIKGADFLVRGSSNIAKKFNISEIVIGLTIVSIGTSMPELFISVTSALEGSSNLTIGNAIGSNISNVFLILGISAIIKEIPLKRETKFIEIPVCLFVTVIFVVLCNIGSTITKMKGVYLIIIFILFIIYTFIMSRETRKDEEKEVKTIEEMSQIKGLFYIVLGIFGLRIGGELTVNNAIKIAETLNISEKIISLTILSIGTSLPELVTSITAGLKGESDIAIGSVLGSNVFNMLLIIGIASIINPIEYDLSYNKDMIFMISGIVLLSIFAMIPPQNKINRAKGLIYFGLYIGYMVMLFI